MRKFLSVLLAVMMVVSTVSFAAPSAVDTAEPATNAVVEETTEETTEIEEANLLADDTWYDLNLGEKLFEIDFSTKGNGSALTASDIASITNGRLDGNANAGVAVADIAKVNPNYSEYGFRVGIKDGGTVTLTDGSLTATASGTPSFYFRNSYVGKGKYTFMFDYNKSCDASFYANSGYTGGTLTKEELDSTWMKVTYVVDELNDSNHISADSYASDYLRMMAHRASADGKFVFDNVKVYYMPEGWSPERSNTWYNTTKGTLLFNMDFDEDNSGKAVSASAYDAISLGSYSAGAGELVSGLGRLNPNVEGNYDIGFRYTKAGTASVNEENGNKYFSVNAIGTSNQFSLYLGNTFTKAGKYVLEYDYKVDSSLSPNYINYNTPSNGNDTNFAFGQWKTATTTYNLTGASNAARIIFYATGNYAAADTLSLDNIKVWYFDESENYGEKVLEKYVTIYSGRDDIENVVVPVASGTSVSVAQAMAIAGANFADCIGFAETADGGILSPDTVITIDSDKSFHAVWGFDAAVSANGNDKVSDVTVENIDTRYGITVADLMSRIDVSASTKPLLGLSTSATGTLLAADTVITSSAPLYMIWGAESLANKWYDEEMGTRLFLMDFESNNSGAAITDSDFAGIGNQSLYSNALTDSIGAFIKKLGRMNPCIGPEYDRMFKIGFRNAPSSTSIAGDASNKYMVANISAAMSLITNHHYVGNGVYTLIFDYKNDCGTTFNIHSGYTGGTTTTENVDVTWNRLTYTVTVGSNNYFRFISGSAPANGSFAFDNIALYFKPTGKLDLTIAGNVYSVNEGTYTANELVELVKADIPTCVGFSKTADGDVISGDATIDVKVNTTLYAVAGFDVTLKAGDNADFSDVTLTGYNSKDGVTVGELLNKIENNTARLVKGLSETAGGALLSKDTVVREAKALYINWTVDESTLGTLVFNMDFEKDGIAAPSEAVSINTITDIYNADLVPEGIKFQPTRVNSFRLENADGNTYYVVNTESDSRCKLNINEFETGGFAWTDGTYTLVADIKAEAAAVLSSDQFTVIEQFYNELGQWNRVSFTFNGAASSGVNESGEPYGTLNFCIQAPAGTPLSIDNVKLYFKTDVTTITVKNGGNTDIEDVVVDVSTASGITVEELIAIVNEEETTRTLLGLSETPTGELLELDKVIVPKYPVYLYAVWKSKSNNPYIDDNLGKMIFEVDFENEAVINANWAGYAELDNATNASAGERITKIASYYDPMLEGKNVRLLVRLNTSDYSQVGIKTAADGNHYIEGVINTSNPKVQILNNASLALENGVYTLYLDSVATGDGSISDQKFDPYTVTYVEGDANSDGKFDYTPAAWTTYGLSFGINDGGVLPSGQVHYNIPTGNTVAYDNVKLYYKPYKATVTILPGEFEIFGTHTVEGISTTGENTGADIVAAIQDKLDACGREFVGLMDEYGDMLDLSKALILPCDMTYTIIWGEADEMAPVTKKTSSIRYSSNVETKGVRFAADLVPEIAYSDEASEYGWIITRKSFLDKKGISYATFTKDSDVKIISGANYNASVTGDTRKHLAEDSDTITITAVVTSVAAKYYREEFVVRPYIVIDGKTHYGDPFVRSYYSAAEAIKNNGYAGCNENTKAYVDEIIANAPAAN